MKRKGISPIISMPLYISLVLLTVSVILLTGLPMSERYKESKSIDNAKNSLRDFYYDVKNVASLEKGAFRDKTLRFQKGSLYVDPGEEKIVYMLETTSNLVSSNTTKELAGMIISSEDTGIKDKKEVSIALSFEEVNLSNYLSLSPGVHDLRILRREKSVEIIVPEK